ncbi:C4-dicarboxylate ABC transporter permease [Roseibium algicola]|uniref:TRAP transporter small permease protein n=1 Tax=Roseibium algicola TaxID=2857014 RepID=A0ABM6I096_9HYPH|nr:TRAP transporter small permease subunit [Roseibium aggregatum]AQQ03683.1 C4-dicarboxylate ABC transporter permease [Roseibium aggregatum]WJS02531.1 TRAP transporter small permease subunit [Roseibium aggregatum]
MREWAARTSARLNTGVEAVIALLMALLVLDVWLGVVDRYFFHWQLPWPEILARYLMIWAAMLAVSSGIARRDHIGLTAAIMRVPVSLRRIVLMAIDLCVLALFLYVLWYGLSFAQSGAKRQAMIFGISLQPFYAAIPAAAALASIQTVLAMIRDNGTHLDNPPFAEAAA